MKQNVKNQICLIIILDTQIVRLLYSHDLRMEVVTNESGKFAKKHEERLLHHVKVEAIQLLDNSELVRRLKKKKPF